MPSERWIQPIWQERQRVTKKSSDAVRGETKKSSDQTEHGVTNTQEKKCG